MRMVSARGDRGQHRCRAIALVAAALAGSAAFGLAATSSRAAVTASPPAAAAVTVSGHGPFANLKVTVGQTAHLVDQVIKVSWTGGTPTISSTQYAADYLQIMQCWGDSAAGPDPRQCQFGGSSALGAGAGSQGAGAFTNTRQLSYGNLVDPAQPLPPPPPGGQSYMPFHSVTGDVITTGSWNQFYDVNTTNEVPYARSNPDGTGEVFFETQTVLEAPGLGCGQPLTKSGQVTGRSCWLVIVPRGETEVDGSSYKTQPSGLLQSSPLSATNWAQRLVVPLTFEPVGQFCPIGAAERSTLGDEMVNEAVVRWQPTLCQSGPKTIYGYLQVTDETARAKLVSGQPGMVFLNRPVPPGQVPAGQSPVYAPVALSGLTIGFSVESQAGFGAPAGVVAQNGKRLPSLNLTARLVAKLLTESYRDGNSRFADDVKNNPFNLGHDPEFLKYNPGYANLDFGGKLGDALVPEPLADATQALWNWVAQDPAAREFLSGVPDNAGKYGNPSFSGMTVNPNYKAMALPIDSFPKSDPYCQTFPDHPNNPLCIQDKHPYATDMHGAARAAGRGDSLARTSWDPTATPPAYKKDPPQPAGQQALLAVTDTATAARYGLVTANLLNAAGQFVAPTTASLLAGEAAMKPSGVNGVLETNPATTAKGAYPLTLLCYAATVPAKLTATAGRDYAALLRYAAGAGQVPGLTQGTLPAGYAPLPSALRRQTLASASTIQAQVGRSQPGSGSTSPGGAGSPGGSSAGSPGGSSGGQPGTGSTPALGGLRSTRSPSPTSPAGVPSLPAASPQAATSRTPATRSGPMRDVVLISLIGGTAAAAAGPLLPRFAPKLATRLTPKPWR